MQLYNTEEGIKGYISEGLAGLNLLIKNRWEANRKFGEKLDCWLFAKRYFSNIHGDTGLVLWEDLPFDFPIDAVFSLNDLNKLGLNPTFSIGHLPPKENEKCLLCGKTWTINDCHLSIQHVDANNIGHAHPSCVRIVINTKERKFFESLLEKASYELFYMKDIENGYWANRNELDVHPPWFEVNVPGAILKMGWRKRVINIEVAGGDWKIPKELDHQSENYVHVFNEQDAIRALKTIREHNS